MTLAAITHLHPQCRLRRVGCVPLGINTGLQLKITAAGLPRTTANRMAAVQGAVFETPGQRFSARRVSPPGAP